MLRLKTYNQINKLTDNLLTLAYEIKLGGWILHGPIFATQRKRTDLYIIHESLSALASITRFLGSYIVKHLVSVLNLVFSQSVQSASMNRPMALTEYKQCRCLAQYFESRQNQPLWFLTQTGLYILR